MNFDRLREFVRAGLTGRTLVIVSNREPYVHRHDGSAIRVEKPAGGLTSAMDDVLRSAGGKWVAWGSGSADRNVVTADSVMVPPEDPAYSLRRVWLTASEVENYYHGYSNRVLWPMCHMALDRVYYRNRFWESYKRANSAFAQAVSEEAGDGSVVWFHDYQLCLAPRMLREKRPGLVLLHFWHIPWPDWGIFRVCPQARDILEAMLCNDLIGFQIPLFVKNFMDCARECLGADIDMEGSAITYRGRTTRLKAYPISIDYDRFNAAASSRRTARSIKRLKARYGLPTLTGVGVDRLEYTKALIKRLQALDLFFERYEKFRGRFSFIQIAVPTRMKEPYLSYKKAVEELVVRINGRYSTDAWKPIVYIDRKIEHRDLVAYYRMADLAIISSIYDGMNLVAKEYAASQTDETGVLILSELAGAAEELDGALPVNPYDIEAFARSIKNALTMHQKEKAQRMSALRRQISENDVYKWMHDIFKDVFTIPSGRIGACRYLFDHLDEIKERFSSGGIFLFLDYDGTMTPIAETPDKAVMPEDMRQAVATLAERMPVAVVTGRGLADIKRLVGMERLVYAGNHGSEIWDGKQGVLLMSSGADTQGMKEILDRLRSALAHIDGVLIEDKDITASVHYRMVREEDVPGLLDIFTKVSREHGGPFRITSGKKVLEIRPQDAWDKGRAVSWILKEMGGGRTPVYIGDDRTDEDAFEAIKGIGVSVCVGPCSSADFYLKTQGEVKDLLALLIELTGAAVSG